MDATTVGWMMTVWGCLKSRTSTHVMHAAVKELIGSLYIWSSWDAWKLTYANKLDSLNLSDEVQAENKIVDVVCLQSWALLNAPHLLLRQYLKQLG